MQQSIVRYRKRTGATQQDVANMLFTDKSQICKMEKGDRNMTAAMYQAGFENVPDSQMLSDMAYELTNGFTSPTPSDRVYDDHRLAFSMRVVREMKELKAVMAEHNLDKHPQFLSQDDKAEINHIVSEVQDVIFEATGFLMKLVNDYDFITPQSIQKNRDMRLKMERRI
ncbi:helix-turn-helix domain-containing protein [Salinicoccus roseus]|uniref:helix-turn-helix domain-containing protein n=1 Tax=Salinicoccus roseus TaxID=45670 RepID=UPI002300BBE9|nr:helix-turn-helix transcriptional regulator [Salinicoccus roseus]